MSDFSKNLVRELKETILKVQGISRTESCSICVGWKDERHFATLRFPDGGKPECTTTQNDERIFAGASLFKVFIATGVSLMIEKFSISSDPANKYQTLRGAWGRAFTGAFNDLSKDFQLKPLEGGPTILDLVVHCKGPYDINHLLLAPDGSLLLSENDFLTTIAQYTQETRHRHEIGSSWCEYSNANYILLALLIEVASGITLGDFLKQHIFQPLGMNRTYTTVEELNSVPLERRAYPHVVSGTGIRRTFAFDTIPHLADTVELAAMGGYTCAGDLGIFFGTVQKLLWGPPGDAEFNKDFAHSLFRGLGGIYGQESNGYTRFGLDTALDEDLPGSHSLNRLIPPTKSTSSDYTLGRTASEDKSIKAYYMAGSATGWGSTVYFLPKYELFVIVLTNSSGPLDASDIIARLYLQQILNLQPSKVGAKNFECRPKGWESMNSAETYRAHYIELAEKIYNENAAVLRQLEENDTAKDTSSADSPGVCGSYVNKKAAQSLEVTDVDGVLRVQLCGQSKQSKLMRFVRKGKRFRICSLGPPGLAIDCFGDWRDLEFDFKEENGVASLSRNGCNMVDVFIREPR